VTVLLVLSMLMIARKALASAHTKAFRLATRDVHCFSSILVSPPLVSLDLPENWIPYSDPPPPVSFGNTLCCIFMAIYICYKKIL
jgi:hypothetical protein